MWACPRHRHVNMVRLYCPIAAAYYLVPRLQLNSFPWFTRSRLYEVTHRSFAVQCRESSCRSACHLYNSTSAACWNNLQHFMSRIVHTGALRLEATHSCKLVLCQRPIMSIVNQYLSSAEVTPKHTKSSISEQVNGVDDDLQRFDDLFKVLVKDLSSYGDKSSEISEGLKRFTLVNEYNVPHGKKNRGLTVVHSYRYLMASSSTEEGEKLAMILGWCIEWLQAYFLVADDIMDSSVTRRGQPCWYKKPEVGLIAINDSFYLESAIYFLLKKYFRHLPYYADLVDLFHETTLQTVIGQNLDLVTAPTDRVDFSSFSIERYNAIVKYKTAFYSFYLPVACAMYMSSLKRIEKVIQTAGAHTLKARLAIAVLIDGTIRSVRVVDRNNIIVPVAGISDASSHSNSQVILLKMGEYFQIQDDFLDCFGDPSVTGKIGTDIEDNKCSWLIVQALSRANDEQRAALLANYAQHSPACVERVKNIYKELGLPDAYVEYEDNSYSSLIELIDSLTGALPRDMFVAYARKIYKRTK